MKLELMHIRTINISLLLIIFFQFSLLSTASANTSNTYDEAGVNVSEQISKALQQADLIEHHYNKGKFHIKKGNHNEAIEHLEKTLKVMPSYKPAQMYLEITKLDKKVYIAGKHYKDGKIAYRKGQYSSAVESFEKSLEALPYYEPAQLYLNIAMVEHRAEIQNEKIDYVKMQMADVIADYDRKLRELDGLAFTYLLEQALLRCQSGDFAGAEYYYNLCYKIDPGSKQTIGWFVDATYELKDLYKSLDESYKEIESLAYSGFGA